MSIPSFGGAVPRRSGRGGDYDADDYTDNASIAKGRIWSVAGDVYQGISGATKKLVGAFYSVSVDSYGRPQLTKMKIGLDDLVDLPDETTKMLHTEFSKFWTAAPKISSMGLSVKRGIMMVGPPGSGKTSAIHAMAGHMIKDLGGVVIYAGRPDHTSACLALFRRIEPDRPLIVVYEDLDALVERYGESGYLSLLDGETQIGNVCNVATTNYPERLDKRFVDRPGRFDRIAVVDMPSAQARAAYIKARMPDIEEELLDKWVRRSDGWSIAHLRELIMATQALGEDAGETIDRLNDMRENRPKSEEGGKVGF